MSRKIVLRVVITVILAAGLYSIIHAVSYKEQIDFNTQIRLILNKKCISCHGGVKKSGGFSMLFPEEAVLPNESGKPAIVPGHPEKSEMIRRITHHDPEIRMPLKAEPLSEEEIELLKKWIKQGAQWGRHWSFIAPQPVDVPDISSDWINNDIDKFILSRLEEEDLDPSSQTDKATLLRRVSLDLIGLPPASKELQDFLNDNSPEAYEKVVDRLLASPRYGERWASMWMDLARYADSKGYVTDEHRNIWQYRDWLIKAFNEDKPYDKFIIEQLAGDLLPKPTDNQYIATAFHRNTLNNEEGGTSNEEFRVAAVVDRVNTTWNALMATTMECVQCHSHPYDPIRHEDYYKTYAFFNNTADADVRSESPNLKTFTNAVDKQDLRKIKSWVIQHTSDAAKKAGQADEFVDLVRFAEPKMHGHYFDKIEKGALIAYQNLAVEGGGHSRLADVPLHNADQMLVSYRASRSTGTVEIRLDKPDGRLIGTWKVQKNSKPRFEIVGIPIVPTAGVRNLYFVFKEQAGKNKKGKKSYVCTIEWVLFHDKVPGAGQPGYAEIRNDFFKLLNTKDAIETPVMVELQGDYKRTSYVFERGNWMVHGDKIEPGVPESLNPMPKGAPKNRLGFAQWVVSKDNPLTARVMVNRLWAQLFGTGIVETLEDFGSMGAPPSHPHLLDWMSLQFMNNYKWSIKAMLKTMVMSAAYQQSSKVTPELLEKDPKNYLLARGPRVRLTAEQIRDQALAVSGLLSAKMYGPSVMPVQPDAIWKEVVNSSRKWVTSTGEDEHRRALYTYWRRGRPYPSLITFDSPSREVCVTRRIPTNTPLQALVTLNDPAYMEAAEALARRMAAGSQDNAMEQIKKGYRLSMMKEIDADKLQELQKLYEQSVQHFKKEPKAAFELVGEKNIPLAALTVTANVLLNLDEFVTKI